MYDENVLIWQNKEYNKKDLQSLLSLWTNWIDNKINFSFVKFGDGEFLCMMGNNGMNCDFHPYSKSLSDKLYESWYFLTKFENVYIAEWLNMKFKDDLVSKTDIKMNFVNFEILLQNYLCDEKFNFYRSIKQSKRKKIFVGPNRLKGVLDFLDIDKFVEVPLVNSFSEYDNILDVLYSEIEDDSIFLFSAGMPSKSLIHKILERNINVTCLDIGSGFDSIFIGKTRDGQIPDEAKNFYSQLLNKRKGFSVLVNTTDSYEDCWFPFFTLYEKYLNIPNKIYLNTETKEYNFKNLVSLKNGLVDNKWTDCLIQSLQSIDEDYILYLQDDYFLTKQVDIQELNRFYNLFLNLDLDCLHLSKQNTDGPFNVTENDIWEIPLGTDYRISTQVAFWKKSSLLKYILPNKTGWEFEIESFNRVDQPLKIYGLNRYKFSEVISYVSATGIIKGKWNDKVYEVFKINNIDVDLTKR